MVLLVDANMRMPFLIKCFALEPTRLNKITSKISTEFIVKVLLHRHSWLDYAASFCSSWNDARSNIRRSVGDITEDILFQE